MVQQISSNTFTTAKWIVSSDATQGTHTTIATAITSASSGDTIFIRPGTYTENLTLKAGVNLVAFSSDSSLNGTGHVIISGTCTLTTAGTVTISGIQLQTNSAALLAVTGTLASVVNLNDCYLNCTNSTGITFSSSNASAKINISLCAGDVGTTAISLFAHSSAGTLYVSNSNFSNSGSSTTASTISAGSFTSFETSMNTPISTSSGGVANLTRTNITTSAINTTSFTSAGTGNHTHYFSTFAAGTASAVSAGTGTTVNLHTCIIESSNTNAITGAGTVNYSSLNFSKGSSLINTTTQTQAFVNLGKSVSSGQPAFLYYLAASTANNVTGDSTQYTLGTDALTKIYDRASNMTTGGTFTAPVTGLYLFNLTIQYVNLAAQTQCQIRIITTAGTYIGAQEAASINVGTVLTQSFSVLANMTAADTATFIALSAGSTKTVGIGGSASPYLTFISGALIC